ncbi:MAG: pyridoxal-phosphate dependent enzyme [Bacteroidota bacterium]|nr:pyridoxal-phosphate dependent enzyme [Bacteroidota bacterium]
MAEKNNLPYPSKEDILKAHQRITPYIHHTPVLTSKTLDSMMNASFFFKCENFQKTGAFKARGATNAVFSLDRESLSFGVATHSSGNHAQGLSRAASLAHTPAYIVMPSNSSNVKVAAVKNYGGEVIFCEPTLEARESTLAEVIKKTKAIEIHPYNNPLIIAGQATAALELLHSVPGLDIILAPVGGGGLLSGTALSAYYFSPDTSVIGTEPDQANDAYLSFTSRTFIPSEHPDTIADGLRTSLGSITFPIILSHVSQIVTVSEQSIIKAMRFVWERMKILIEPSSAVPVAAIMEDKIEIRKKKVGIIISGGNIDLDHLPWIQI